MSDKPTTITISRELWKEISLITVELGNITKPATVKQAIDLLKKQMNEELNLKEK